LSASADVIQIHGVDGDFCLEMLKNDDEDLMTSVEGGGLGF